MSSLPQSAGAQWYRIDNYQMEACCTWCGWPMDVGDRALEAFGAVFCSESCARDSRKDLTTEAKD